MSTCLPDCMMPDGADPCEGYKALQAELARWRAWADGVAVLGAWDETLEAEYDQLVRFGTTKQTDHRLEKIAERCEYALRGPVRSHDFYDRLFREILKVARGEVVGVFRG